MDAGSSWSEFFGLPDFLRAEPRPRRSIRDQLFPICPGCGQTCAEIWA